MGKLITLDDLAKFLDDVSKNRRGTLAWRNGKGNGSVVLGSDEDDSSGDAASRATGKYAVSEGGPNSIGDNAPVASGDYSHAEGHTTESSGFYSHAEGQGTVASGNSSHAEGLYNRTQNTGEHAEGNWNQSHKMSSTYVYGNAANTTHSIGIGTSNSNKKNAFEVMENGDAYLYGLGTYNGTNPVSGTNDIKTIINSKQATLVSGTNIKTVNSTSLLGSGNINTPDTKNTAGSTDSSSKLFIIGATSQAANPQTYSDNELYVTSGVLTTKSVQVGGTAATMQYNSTDKSIEFIFT